VDTLAFFFLLSLSFSVYIRAHDVWTRLLKRLHTADQTALHTWPAVEKETDTRLVKLNQEALVASYDASVLPNMLLLVQAGLPFAPRHPRQHSLQGLARAMMKLSSGANQRQELPLLLERVAAFRGREILQDENATTDSNDASAPPLAGDHKEEEEAGKTEQGKTEEVAAEEEGPEGEAKEDAMGSQGGRASGQIGLYTSANQVVAQGAEMSPHELTLLQVMQSVQWLVLREHAERPPLPRTCPAFQRCRSVGGRTPSQYEARAAFLMLFGETHHLSLTLAQGGSMSVAVTIAGIKGRALLVQRLGADEMAVEEESEGDARVGAEAVAQFGFLQDEKVRGAAQQALLTTLTHAHPEGISLRLRKPPHGFQWASFLAGGAENAEVRVKVEERAPEERRAEESSKGTRKRKGKGKSEEVVETVERKEMVETVQVVEGSDPQGEGQTGHDQEGGVGGDDGLRFFVEGREVEAFNAAMLLEPCNEASQIVALKGFQLRLIRQALYALKVDEVAVADDAVQLFLALQAMASSAREGPVHEGVVFDWMQYIAGKSSLSKQVWRDVLLTITTRDKDVIGIAMVNRWGAPARQAVRPMSEGTVLRLLYTLEALYPCVLARTRSQFAWRLMPAGAAFVHMCASLDKLARMELARVDLSPAMAHSITAPALLPSVATELWPHQREARDRVLLGIQHGKLGFADASAVGAGKTLTALACVCSVAQHLASKDVQRHGSLVLVPVNELVSEWVMQAMQHTSNLHIIEQRASGKLFSPYFKRGNPPIDGNSVVISTLARVREHPFAKSAWDFVVIDECLSVQNDTALQTAEAWRQVEASQCGVLMLSATFFRSNYAKLFYMIRMLRSPIPREQKFLTTTLVEHIVCYVPKNRRTWKLTYQGVPLEDKAGTEYSSMLTNFHRKPPGEQDHRTLYVSLKHLLTTHYEPDTLPRAVAAAAQRLISKGRRPLIFANTEKELVRIFKHLPCARRWSGQRGSAGEEEGGGSALVVTLHAAAQGLNMQHAADCIICRPQPGDRLEQMKGRIDRPGQRRHELELLVLMAASTVEEAEAANIRLCGSFFRHYIAPHSRQFELLAIDASLSSAINTNEKGKTSKASVQAAFRKGVSMFALGRPDAGGGARKRSSAAWGEDDAEDEIDQDDPNLAWGGGWEGREEGQGSTGHATPQAAPSKKTKVGACPWLKIKSEKVAGAEPRKLAYDLSSAAPAVLDRGLLRKAAVHLSAVDPTLSILIKRIGLTCVPMRRK
jgi:hypothetical protein